MALLTSGGFKGSGLDCIVVGKRGAVVLPKDAIWWDRSGVCNEALRVKSCIIRR